MIPDNFYFKILYLPRKYHLAMTMGCVWLQLEGQLKDTLELMLLGQIINNLKSSLLGGGE